MRIFLRTPHLLIIAARFNRFAGFVYIAIEGLTGTAKEFRETVLPFNREERLCNFHNLAQSFYSGAWAEQSNRRAEFKWAFWSSFFRHASGFFLHRVKLSGQKPRCGLRVFSSLVFLFGV